MALRAAGGASTSAVQHRTSPAVSSSRQFRPSRVCGQPNRLRCSSSAAGSLGGAVPGEPEGQPQERVYKPFPRLRESDPYRLLGLTKGAEFEEVVSARNYLFEEYRWHEPSREAIELAFDTIIQEKLKTRSKFGFQAAGSARSRRVESSSTNPSLARRISDMVDPTVTFATLVNEGFVYVGLALWALSSTDQSFPLAGAFAYSVYKFQNKRVKAKPDGPFLGGNPMIGALLITLFNLALGCGLMTILTVPLTPYIEGSIRQLGGCVVILLMGFLGVYLK